jgi:phosphoadenosine phosphosulfate reductase
MESLQQTWAEISDEDTDPVILLRRSIRAFGDQLLLATSLGPQSLVILDLAYRSGLRFDVALIDTGLLFDETLALAAEIESRYQLEIIRARPRKTLVEQAAEEGAELWLSDPDRCCQLRKVGPMASLLSGYRAWITGLRRDQSASRSDTKPVEWDEQFGLFKLSPLVDWSADQVSSYLRDNGVPYNPLLDEGYRSVGCTPCTVPSGDLGAERAGRWVGHSKTECGLHNRPVHIKKRINNSGVK